MPIIFEPPAALLAAQQAGNLGSLGDGSGVAPSGGSQVWIAASPQNADPNWGGCEVWLSFDDSTFKRIGAITAPAKEGVLTADLAAFSATNPDSADTLGVDLAMSGGELPTASDADAQAARTLAYVDREYIAFGETTPTTGDAYDLSDLYRGLFGSSASAHATGASFVFLDGAVFKYNLPSSYAGQTLYFKFPSFNVYGGATQDLAALTAVSYTPAGGIPPTGLITGGDATVSAAGVISLTATGVTTGAYTLADITVDAKGRVTAASNGSVAVPAAANPTASAGLSAVDGSATTFMRSDGAPAIDQSISPTWTGRHSFTGVTDLPSIILDSPSGEHYSGIELQGDAGTYEGDLASDASYVYLNSAGGIEFRVTSDAYVHGTAALSISSAGNIAVGNQTPSSDAVFTFGGVVEARQLLLYENVSSHAYYGFGIQGGEMRMFFPNTGHWAFGTISQDSSETYAEIARLTGGGALGIGTTPSTMLDIAGAYRAVPTTVAALPTGYDGARHFVTDSTVAASGNFGAAVSGGGSYHVPVYYDGGTSAWRIG